MNANNKFNVFQFLIVRLKEQKRANEMNYKIISIPYSTIKSKIQHVFPWRGVVFQFLIVRLVLVR